MTDLFLPELLKTTNLDASGAMTLLGAEFEFEWYEAAILPTAKAFLKITTPPNKYTLVNFREVRMDQTRGFYRQYRSTSFSGGTVTRTITPIKMRGDSAVPSGALLQVVTAPTITGAPFSEIPLWGAEGVGNRPQGGGLSQTGAFRVIPPNQQILLEFTNDSTNPAAWYAYFKQFEVLPATMLQLAEI
ncbi:MAG: hypothetical protein RR182_00975 [Alistipes sp.]